MKMIKTFAAMMTGAAALSLASQSTAQADEPFLAEIRMNGYTFCPRGWVETDGRLLPIAQNTALFSILGTIYGGDGRTTFGVPDLRGRFPVGEGNGPGLAPRSQGQTGGNESIVLSVGNLPSHQHTAHAASNNAPVVTSPSNAGIDPEGRFAVGGTAQAMSNQTIGHTGGNQPANIMQPYLALRYCMATQGLFPSRN